jgi:hypothetical protein
MRWIETPPNLTDVINLKSRSEGTAEPPESKAMKLI